LNIDFPVLFTELSTIDALIQRMGRILRFSKGSYSKPFIYQEDTPNIYVFTVATGIKTIYDQNIVENSLTALIDYDDKLLGEEDKQAVVHNIFQRKNLKGTNYLRKFELSLKLLENGLEANNRTEAQTLFRKISNITVIPLSIKERYHDELEAALDILETKPATREERISALYSLRKYSLSIPAFRMKKKPQILRGDLFMTTMEYSPELGLIPDKETENIL
jgi:CRISPR-associated endonuclease/helicase Cas3